ncbi:hypothetical protein BamMEX5DRAFT_6428 [Burkholderia ambifaria MEX-5]|uniref:Uncharacterized protein n=1 Tax=Burkholderia ambifaria MEX-5 TaxID=396597 RepID=B1TF62_9BURK|nr:hypothetical protein BamMEX5DRAFT_6428 [Burkholderia ambifaria MEX-5]
MQLQRSARNLPLGTELSESPHFTPAFIPSRCRQSSLNRLLISDSFEKKHPPILRVSYPLRRPTTSTPCRTRFRVHIFWNHPPPPVFVQKRKHILRNEHVLPYFRSNFSNNLANLSFTSRLNFSLKIIEPNLKIFITLHFHLSHHIPPNLVDFWQSLCTNISTTTQHFTITKKQILISHCSFSNFHTARQK